MSWNEIADDHYVALSWSHGVGVGADCGNGPPCDNPNYGGIDSWIWRKSRVPANLYQCKFCRQSIGFINKRPYNHSDGSPHTCLRDRAKAAPSARDLAIAKARAAGLTDDDIRAIAASTKGGEA